MIRVLALASAVVVLAVASAASQPQVLDGIVVGANIRDAVKLLGNPDVVNTDVGHVWTWHDAKTGEIVRATTDDAGVIDMIDVSAPSGDAHQIPAKVGTATPAFIFGSGHLDQPGFADSAKALSISQGSLPDSGDTAEFWRFAATPSQQVIFGYATAVTAMPSSPLREIFLGDADALANAGLIPDKAADEGLYRAPLLDSIGSADYQSTKSGVAYSRIAIDANGTIAKSTIFISSGNAQLDEIALTIANGCTFEPATRGGRHIPSIYFRRENFLITS